MPGWLFGLLAAAFVLYTDDYVIAGILPELAGELGVTEGQAGQGVLAALAAAGCTPALFAFAARHASEGRVGTYIAVVSLGVTGSIAAGVPVGTWIGGTFGWRATFAAMAIAGALVVIVVLSALPRPEGAEEAPALGEQVRTLRQLPIVLGLLANCVLMTGSMMMLTYLAPYLAETTTDGVEGRAVAFSLAGIAGMAGIWLGGLATDRWGADRALLFGVSVIVAAMVALWALWASRPASLPLVLAVATVWGGMAFWNSPAIQARLHRLAGPVSGQALALNTSGTYLGVSLGAAGGGVILTGSGPGVLPLSAAGVAIAALLLLALARRATRVVAPG